MKRLFVCVLLAASLVGAGADAAPDEAGRRLNTLRYGIEPQVIELLSTLQNEKNVDYTKELLTVLDRSTSPKLRGAILDYFAALSLPDAESRAADYIAHRDEQADGLIGSAFSYLIAIKSKASLTDAAAILKQNETRYYAGAIKLIGAVGSDDLVAALRTLYESDGTNQSTKEMIVLALGSMKATSSFDFLGTIATAEESAKTLRMYACTALGNLGDERGIGILVKASISNDPNVRASALAALGTYGTAEARSAILEGLRDANVIPRLAACKASGVAGNTDAVPYLAYKASYDPERSVREASIAALSQIGGDHVDDFLLNYIEDTKNEAGYRAAALAGLIAKGASASRGKARTLLLSAQEDKDRSLFAALARAIVAIDAPEAERFVEVLLADKDFSVRLGALAWAERNKATAMLPLVQSVADSDSNDAVKRRAALVVERLRAAGSTP